MANTNTKQVLHDGGRNYVVHIFLASDGVTGDITDDVVVDVSAIDPIPTDVKLVRAYGSITGFSAVLEWDADTDVAFLQIPDGDYFDYDFCKIGGIINNAGTGVTGDVLLTTSGLDTAGDQGTITLEFKKRGVDTYDND